MRQFSPTSLVVNLVLLLSVPQSDAFGFHSRNQGSAGIQSQFQQVVNVEKSVSEGRCLNCDDVFRGSMLALSLAFSFATPVMAVSGGGLDYAGIDISGQDFSNESKAYKGKDFTQVLAKATNFANSNFQGCRFYKAYLVNADFSNSDIRGVS